MARFERKAISNSKFQMAERATARAVWLVEGLQQRLSCSWDILEFLGATKSGCVAVLFYALILVRWRSAELRTGSALNDEDDGENWMVGTIVGSRMLGGDFAGFCAGWIRADDEEACAEKRAAAFDGGLLLDARGPKCRSAAIGAARGGRGDGE